MPEGYVYCLSVPRPDDVVLTPLTVPMAYCYAEHILNKSNTQVTAGVERSDEKRKGAFLEV